MTARTGTPPNHDTLTCYTNYRCRRPACVQRARDWERNRRAALKAGQWQPFIDAAPVRDHLILLLARGVSLCRVGELAGLGPHFLYSFLPPKNGRRRPVRHTVSPDVAQKVLAIDPDTANPAITEPTGTVRRLQALVANGWPMSHLATRLAVTPTYVSALIKRGENNRPVLAATAQKVAATYTQLSDRRPTHGGVQPGQAKRARNLAAANGWPNTRYWATRMDVIDDPHFEPDYGRTKAQILAEDARWLMAKSGLDREQVAERLGTSRSYIDRVLIQHPGPKQATA